jgi:hypothetical protein
MHPDYWIYAGLLGRIYDGVLGTQWTPIRRDLSENRIRRRVELVADDQARVVRFPSHSVPLLWDGLMLISSTLWRNVKRYSECQFTQLYFEKLYFDRSSGQTPDRVLSRREEKVKLREVNSDTQQATISAVNGWHKFARASHFCFPLPSFVLFNFVFFPPSLFFPSLSFIRFPSQFSWRNDFIHTD